MKTKLEIKGKRTHKCNSWRREWQTTPVFLPGKFHGQRSLAGYSPWGSKESDMTEQLTHTKVAAREQPRWEEHGLLIREPGAPGSQECVGYS